LIQNKTNTSVPKLYTRSQINPEKTKSTLIHFVNNEIRKNSEFQKTKSKRKLFYIPDIPSLSEQPNTPPKLALL
jgi:hypothetical protein